jgi:NADH:ubiquinone oxidoreductase subunit D
MPRYVYSCSKCDGYFQVWHGMKEIQESCQLCPESNCLTKVPQIPLFKKEQSRDSSVGDITKDYIKQNQELLKEMKKEARNQTYEE